MKYEVITDAEKLPEVAREILKAPTIGLDLETTGWLPWRGEIRLCQLRVNGKLFIIDMFQTKTMGPVVDALRDSNGIKIVQNAKFEQKWFSYKYGIELWPLFDTFRASAMIHNGRDFSHDIYSIARRELSVEPSVETGLGGSDWSGKLSKRQLDYAAWDVRYLDGMRDKLRKQLFDLGLTKVALFEFGAILPESWIELTGFYLNRDLWLELANTNRIEAAALGRELRLKLPHPGDQMPFPGMESNINLNSPIQVKKILKKMGIEVDSTAQDVLAMVAGDNPLVQKFMKYRGYSKACSAFGSDYLQNIDPHTGRIHPDFYPMLKSGRYGCRKPNLAQIPRDTRYRAAFQVPEGRALVAADYSQIELRFLAQISGDRTLRLAYKHGEDIHRKTAALVTGCSPDAVTKDQRQQAKPVNFGFSFGMGEERFIVYAQADYGVHFTKPQAKKFRNAFFDAYPGVRAWHKKAIAEGQRTGVARTIAGRLRWLDGDQYYNEFLNHPIQGGNADGMKNSLRIVHRKLDALGCDAKMVHMVHDEILAETNSDPEAVRLTQKAIEDGMFEGMTPLLRNVPVVVESGSGNSWAAKG